MTRRSAIQNWSEAAERNKGPILEKLISHLDQPGTVLEIGSGSGQHALFFAAELPHLTWQATETAENLSILQDNLFCHQGGNLKPPLELDVRTSTWPIDSVSYIFSANTLHIMPWGAVEKLFAGAGRCLNPGGLLCIYGAMRYNQAFTSQSNAHFDTTLKSQDPQRGIRDFEALAALATQHGLQQVADYQMPSHNQLLVWRKTRT